MLNNTNTPATKPTTVKKEWKDMSKQERHDLSLAKKVQAITKVQEGDFPAAVRVKLGEHTLFAKPSGVSEKGSVSYSINPTILTLGNKQVRINKLNLSVLASGMEGVEELDLTDSNIL
jgi:hypothetical protein